MVEILTSSESAKHFHTTDTMSVHHSELHHSTDSAHLKSGSCTPNTADKYLTNLTIHDPSCEIGNRQAAANAKPEPTNAAQAEAQVERPSIAAVVKSAILSAGKPELAGTTRPDNGESAKADGKSHEVVPTTTPAAEARPQTTTRESQADPWNGIASTIDSSRALNALKTLGHDIADGATSGFGFLANLISEQAHERK